jgi:hypothetical protein
LDIDISKMCLVACQMADDGMNEVEAWTGSSSSDLFFLEVLKVDRAALATPWS